MRTGGDALAVLRFETAWTNDRIPYEEEDESVPFWPILIIRFARLRQLTVNEDPSRVGGGGEFIRYVESRPLVNGESSGGHKTVVEIATVEVARAG